MPGTHENGPGEPRLDRLEGLMALLIDDHVQFREEHKQLLTAQILLTLTVWIASSKRLAKPINNSLKLRSIPTSV